MERNVQKADIYLYLRDVFTAAVSQKGINFASHIFEYQNSLLYSLYRRGHASALVSHRNDQSLRSRIVDVMLCVRFSRSFARKLTLTEHRVDSSCSEMFTNCLHINLYLRDVLKAAFSYGDTDRTPLPTAKQQDRF